MQVGPYPLEFVCDRLRAFAAEYKTGAGPATRYVLGNGQLINERVVHADAALVMRTLGRQRGLHVVELPLSAERVLVKNNIRIIGLGRRGELVVRLQVRRGRRFSLGREVRMRRVLSALLEQAPGIARHLAIPRMVRVGPAMSWLVEERAPGGIMVGPAAMDAFLRVHAPALYGLTARSRLLRPLDEPEALYAEVRRLVPGMAMQRLDGPVAFALCHGDLNLTNILSPQPGYFWLIDLEEAGLRPVAIDVAKPLVEFPGLAYPALAALQGLPAAPGDLSPPLQLLLGVAHRSICHRAAFDTNIADQVQLFGRSQQEALAGHQRLAGNLQRIAQEMARIG